MVKVLRKFDVNPKKFHLFSLVMIYAVINASIWLLPELPKYVKFTHINHF